MLLVRELPVEVCLSGKYLLAMIYEKRGKIDKGTQFFLFLISCFISVSFSFLISSCFFLISSYFFLFFWYFFWLIFSQFSSCLFFSVLSFFFNFFLHFILMPKFLYSSLFFSYTFFEYLTEIEKEMQKNKKCINLLKLLKSRM